MPAELPIHIVRLLLEHSHGMVTIEGAETLSNWAAHSEENRQTADHLLHGLPRPALADQTDPFPLNPTIDPHHLSYLVKKSLDGKLDEQEKEQLHTWRTSSRHNEAIFTILQKEDNRNYLDSLLEQETEDPGQP